jgi:hypothetical protein
VTDQQHFEQWAIVDVMGHQRYIGLVTEQVIAGTGFIRIDVPGNDEVPAWTKIVGASSIYAITPVSEEIARGMAEVTRSRPIQSYELPKQLAGPDEQDDGWPI